MRGFRDRADVTEVLALLEARIRPLEAEPLPLTADLAGRVLAAPVMAAVDVPGFDRAAMDGYAVRAEETFGAGPYNPLEFVVIGQALPGKGFAGVVQPAQAVRIMTGAPLPQGANAVVRAEAATEQAGRVAISEAVSPGRHVGSRGEDLAAGTLVFQAGRVLRPQDLGVLASLGATPVPVVGRPRVAVLVTGDELVPCGASPQGYCIVDSNSIMLSALVRRDGGLPLPVQMVPDQPEAVAAALAGAAADLILISGGSSVGLEDHAPRVLAAAGELCIHGVALRPASPTGVGFLADRPVFLLPGNPVSCLCAYDLFAGPAVRRLGGRSMELPYRTCRLPLAHKLTSVSGRVDYVRVQVRHGGVEPLATSGAALLSSASRADGFVLVSRDREGYAAGEEVVVHLYDEASSWALPT